MADFATDLFGSAEGTELSAHSASWSKVTGIAGNAEIANGRIRPSDSTLTSYQHSGTPASADYSVSVDVYIASVGLSFLGGVTARCSATAHTYYHYRAGNASGSERTQLYKFVDNVPTLLGEAAGKTWSAGETHNLRLEVRGSDILCYFDGDPTPEIAVTDTDITAAGKAGVRFFSGTTPSDTAGIHLDNFIASDPVAPATTLPTRDNLLSLNFNWRGSPFVAVQAKFISVDSLDLNWRGSPIYAAAPAGIAYITASSDVTAPGWTASSGSDLFAMIDEASANDADHITSPTLGAAAPGIFGLNQTLAAGTYTISVRAAYLGTAGQVRVSLLNDSNVSQGTSSWQAVTGSPATYGLSVATSGSATRVRIEVQ